MESMIERVEAAIMGEMARLLRAGEYLALSGNPRKIARAAIEAMREPTEAILSQGPGEPYLDRDVWARMIDTALSPTKEVENGF